MHRKSLALDLKTYYVLNSLGAKLQSKTLPTKTIAKTPYQLLQEFNRSLDLIRVKSSPGGFYHHIKKMINFNLIKPGNEPLDLININQASPPLTLRKKSLEFISSHFEEFLAGSVSYPWSNIIGGLNLILLDGSTGLLAPWIRRIRLELIVIKQSLDQQLSSHPEGDIRNRALINWRQEQVKTMAAYLAEIER